MNSAPSPATTNPNALDPLDSDQRNQELRDLNLKLVPLRLGSIAMFAVYAATILSALVPLRLTDPLWLRNAINVLLSNAVIPLVGLLLLQLLRVMYPDLRPTRQLLKDTSRWALAAAIGFWLLVPLQAAVGFSVLKTADAADLGRSLEARQQIAALRQAIKNAGSSQDLVAAVPGIPASVAEKLAASPLSEARAQLLAKLDGSEANIKLQLGRAQANRRWAVAREAFRNIVSSFALGAAFFALRLKRSAV